MISTSAPEYGLQVAHASKAYRNIQAVRDLSLEIRDGEFFCLLGPSGCGKTTTLHLIAGFIEADSGEISVKGRLVTHLPANKRNMGVVFQDYALFPHMTAAQNIGYGLRVRRAGANRIRERTDALLRLVRLESQADRVPRQLSGGEQQRVAVARALAIDPSILLLDEPLSNLDARLRDEVGAELRRIQRATRITTVMVTHDQQEAFALADRVAVMRSGSIEQAGTPRELYASPANPFVAGFIGRVNLLRGIIVSMVPCQLRAADTLFEISAEVAATSGLATGQMCALALRPEMISVSHACSSNPCYEGRVIDTTFTGATTRVMVQLGQETVEAQANGKFQVSPGTLVHLSWSPNDGRVIPTG